MANTCIIIPCYNEANRLPSEDFLAFSKNNNSIHLLFVDDGSQDNTLAVLKDISDSFLSVSLLALEKNSGKAEAIRQGLLHLNNHYKTIGYLDADLSTPLSEITRLITIAHTKNMPFVMGSRVKRSGATINRRLKRHLFGRIIATLIDSCILKLGIYDTQCGAKVIDAPLAKELFKTPFKTKWLFDVELLLRMKHKYGKAYCKNNILEIPLEYWRDVGASKISFLDILIIPFDLLKLYFSRK
ncbi:glycosyltransferase [Mangrovimonas spongiae]|uniref:Glycosyltransferase n=1 Tax=Mangrovimonas spongiae TaxID=2494697 RepID=A0A3R9USF4_9FLAO|nr:glycosyltransferase [Mangrovimonas spongiae]RSK39175.1 glycosyltransferase [Mangrovimonas spongiae]